jgi:hypothetical protein
VWASDFGGQNFLTIFPTAWRLVLGALLDSGSSDAFTAIFSTFATFAALALLLSVAVLLVARSSNITFITGACCAAEARPESEAAKAAPAPTEADALILPRRPSSAAVAANSMQEGEDAAADDQQHEAREQERQHQEQRDASMSSPAFVAIASIASNA